MSTQTSTYTKAEAKASDAELARLTDIWQAAAANYSNARERVLSAAGARMAFLNGGGKGVSFDGRNRATIEQAREIASGTVEAPRWGDAGRAAAALATFDEAHAAEHAARTTMRAWDDANYKGWQRFFLVPDGHIHATTGCSSLRITTRIGWLPDLSGETEAEAVAAHGAMLCTKCFPSAPVEYTRGIEKPVPADQCSGSNKYVPNANWRLYSPRGNCPECGQTVSVTKAGNARKHKIS